MLDQIEKEAKCGLKKVTRQLRLLAIAKVPVEKVQPLIEQHKFFSGTLRLVRDIKAA